ncbi:MAG: carbamate kinase [Bacteroidales bacterium]|nr:carbamate kinase [Bacteroidales bacterium]
MQKKKIVIALGGNALLRGDQIGTIEEQEKNTTDTLKNIIPFIKEGHDVILSHGNGPQVGNILMRNDAGAEMYDIPQMPLDICVADSQGGIGYMLERMLRNLLIEEGIDKDVVTLVTQTLVSKDDSAFQNPTKRVGRMYPKVQADKLSKEKGWKFKESPKADDAWRRVVASPEPIDIFNIKTIESITKSGAIVIASGGGGIPVYYDEKGQIRALEAVIDKDKATAVLASKINADEYYILTDVSYVYLDFRQHNEKKLDFLNKADAEKYMKEGKFGEGNMAPKIQACLNFIENGGKKSVITEATKLTDKSYGTKITLEYED